MPKTPAPTAHSIAQAWMEDDGHAIYETTQQMLDAGLYTAPCLADITRGFPAIEASALRMDAINIASMLSTTPQNAHAPHEATLFAIPLVGTARALTGFARDRTRRMRLNEGINTSGMLATGAQVHVLEGVWNGEDLLAIHPQMLRDALQQACSLHAQGGDIGQAVLPALAGLPSTVEGRKGNVGAVVFAIVLDFEPSAEDGVVDPLRYLLQDIIPYAIHGPTREAVEQPHVVWKQAWHAHGPRTLSTLTPVMLGESAAACIKIDAITAMLDAGGSQEVPMATAIHSIDDGGALLELSQHDTVLYRQIITPTIFATIGASLLDLFNPIEADDEEIESLLEASLQTAEGDAVGASAPQRPLPNAAALTMAHFLHNLCPPGGRMQ